MGALDFPLPVKRLGVVNRAGDGVKDMGKMENGNK